MRTVLLALILTTTFACTAKPPAKEKAKEPAKEVAKPKEKPAAPSTTKFVEEFETKWKTFKTYQANYFQSIESVTIPGPPDETAGTLYLERPDKLRWEIPAEQGVEILNGKKAFLVKSNSRGTRIVDIYSDARQFANAKSLNFLTGKEKFSAIYTITLVKEDKEAVTLKLVPKDKTPETYIAEISKSSYFLSSLTTETAESRVEIKFSEIQTNLKLEDNLFDYVPKPDDVVQKH